MKYFVKRKRINETTIEKLMIPCADPPPEQFNRAGLEKLKELKSQYQLKEFSARREE